MHFEGSVAASPHETRTSLSTPRLSLNLTITAQSMPSPADTLRTARMSEQRWSLVRLSPGPDYRHNDAVLAIKSFRQPLVRIFVFQRRGLVLNVLQDSLGPLLSLRSESGLTSPHCSSERTSQGSRRIA